jgi:hypothetical protein
VRRRDPDAVEPLFLAVADARRVMMNMACGTISPTWSIRCFGGEAFEKTAVPAVTIRLKMTWPQGLPGTLSSSLPERAVAPSEPQIDVVDRRPRDMRAHVGVPERIEDEKGPDEPGGADRGPPQGPPPQRLVRPAGPPQRHEPEVEQRRCRRASKAGL